MCGVIGIIGNPNAAFEVYKGLYTLQHRGQDAAGILSYDFNSQKFRLVKDTGLVSEVFEEEAVRSLTGEMAIGHNRYSTVGRGEKEDIQPHLMNYPMGIGMAHNGNLVNYHKLTKELKEKHQRHPLTNNDLEVIMNLFANHLSSFGTENINFETLKKSIAKVMDAIIGGYAVVGEIADIGLFAFRDPKGIRPLVYGSRTNDDQSQFTESHIFCSETNTLDYLGYNKVSDVAPGELIFISKSGEVLKAKIKNESARACMFEWVYFSSAESIIDNKSVYEARLSLGEVLGDKVRALMESKEISPDIVAPVPETSRLSAISCAEYLGLTYREILIKNRYIHRSFILNTDAKRSNAVNMKLSPVAHEIKGRKILLIDDSIVRGTTSKKIIKSLRACGAKEIYLASTCPPINYPCYFGVDFPDQTKLIAPNKTIDEIAEVIGVDKLIYIDKNDLAKALGRDDLCMACLDGDYPVSVESAEDFVQTRKVDRGN